ncbi:hypothetical protein ACU4HD_14285 [Cupriavidus basilensis]
MFRRAHDARKRSDIKLTYIIDIEVTGRSGGDQAHGRQAELERDAGHGLPLRRAGTGAGHGACARW